MADTFEFRKGKEFSYEDLQHFTNNFSNENFIGRTQFGILYKGKIPPNQDEKNENIEENVTKKPKIEDKVVTIKMWKTENIIGKAKVWRRLPFYWILELMKDEIRFLGSPLLESNKNVAKVLGHCLEGENVGVVYDLEPLNTVRNILTKNEVFGWRKRIKVALGLAHLLKLLHLYKPTYLVRNLSAAHVVVDQDFNPVVVDFAMIIGGEIGGANCLTNDAIISGSYGYRDVYVATSGKWTERTDVFNFGVILLELMLMLRTDSVGPEGFLDAYARKYYDSLSSKAENGGERCIYVLKPLQADPDFDVEDGDLLTKIVMDCVKYERYNRPYIEEVLTRLENLRVQVD